MNATNFDQRDGFAAARQAMIASQLRTSGVNDMRVLEAMGRVAREDFVPAARAASAYADRRVALDRGRALNPPVTTALLLEAAALRPEQSVLIIGAATGYSIAVAAMLVRHAVGVEVDVTLVSAASTATIVEGPLAAGAAEHAPFDAIVIDGAIEQLPDALVAQLVPDGRLVTGLVEGGVTRLAHGRLIGGRLALKTVADVDAVVLPGFAKLSSFVF